MLDLMRNLQSMPTVSYTNFETAFENALEANAPKKTKFVRGNNKPHVNKELRKDIMKRTNLKNIANKSKREADIRNYKDQRNHVVNLNIKTKREYFKSIQSRTIENDKKFWKTVKPLFSNTNAMSEKITLIQDDKILSKDAEVAECLNTYFTNITDSLDIAPTFREVHEAAEDTMIEKLTMIAIQKYSTHPSIIAIKQKYGTSGNKFEFSHVNPWEVEKQLDSLNVKKSQSGIIPTFLLKATKNVICPFLTDCINCAIHKSAFPDKLKEADISSIFKKGEATLKENYRPLSVLPSTSKIYERLLKDQMIKFFDNKFSNLLSAFREGYSTQHSLIRVIEKWRKCLDSAGIVGTILMDLSKAFDCLPHDLLIAKLEAYGFSANSLCLIYSYLKNRMQRVKIGSVKSSQQIIRAGIPQGSVLGPVLFNIFINDIFLLKLDSDLCNFADDTTLYACGCSLDQIVPMLENDLSALIKWFFENGMVANPGKFQMMFLGLKEQHALRLNINDNKVLTTNRVKLLGIEIDNELNFTAHIQNLCSKVNRKINAFSRLNTFISRPQAILICNAVVLSNFNYCPLIWLFSTKAANNEINRTHKRALRILLKDYDSSFDELLEKSESVKIHDQNLQKLMIEIYKTMKNVNPSYIWEFHERKVVKYDLRTKNLCRLPKTRTTKFGIESLSFRGSLLWNSLCDTIKALPSVAAFKRAIKHWLGDKCNCRICK